MQHVSFYLRGLGASLIGFAGFSALANQLDEVGNLAELSDQLGVSTKRLTGLQFAARQAGVETEQFNALLRKMLVSIGKGATGADEMAKAFADLGLNAAELLALETDESFLRIIAALKRVPTASLRAKYQLAILGRTGVELGAVVEGGREELERLMSVADSAGISIDRSLADKADKAADSLKAAMEAAKGLGRELAGFVAPVIEGMSVLFTKQLADIRLGARMLLDDLNKLKKKAVESLLPETAEERMRREMGVAPYNPPPPKGVPGVSPPTDLERFLEGIDEADKKSRAPHSSGGLRTFKELGIVPTSPNRAVGGIASSIPNKQLAVMEKIYVVLNEIKRQPAGMAK